MEDRILTSSGMIFIEDMGRPHLYHFEEEFEVGDFSDFFKTIFGDLLEELVRPPRTELRFYTQDEGVRREAF